MTNCKYVPGLNDICAECDEPKSDHKPVATTKRCSRCGGEIPQGTTYKRNEDGSVQHAPGDFCPHHKPVTTTGDWEKELRGERKTGRFTDGDGYESLKVDELIVYIRSLLAQNREEVLEAVEEKVKQNILLLDSIGDAERIEELEDVLAILNRLRQ